MSEQKLTVNEPFTLRLNNVMARTGLSRSTIYDKMNVKSPRHDPTFPKQFSLGPGSVGWVQSEIDEWLLARINAKRPKAAKTEPVNVPRKVPIPKIESIAEKIEAELPELDEASITAVRQFLLGKLNNGLTQVFYSEVMASVHLWNDRSGDRAVFEKILENVTRTSHAENGVLLGVIVHEEKVGKTRPSDSFFDLAKSLGYTYINPDIFVEDQSLRMYMYYAFPERQLKVSLNWSSEQRTPAGAKFDADFPISTRV